MHTDTPQRARERNSLSNHGQGSGRPASGDETQVTGYIYAGRTGLVAGVGELNGPGTSDVIADTDAAFAEYAVIVITNPERAILTDRQFLGNIGRQFVKTDVVDHSLQLSVAALQGILIELAILFTSAAESSIRMSGEDKFQALMPQFLEAQLVGMDNHPFGYSGDASQLGLGNPFHLNNTEAAGPIRL
jgi:hypothetical protein